MRGRSLATSLVFGMACTAALALAPRRAHAVGDLPAEGAGISPDVLILLDSTANQNSALLSLSSVSNYYLGTDGPIKQYHVWQRALTGSVVDPSNNIHTPPPNASDPDFDKGVLDLYRDKMWFGLSGIDQVDSSGTGASGGYSYGPSQGGMPDCFWTGVNIFCFGFSRSANTGMRNDSAIGDVRELPFVRLHRSSQLADNTLIQDLLVQTTNPYQGNPDGLMDVFQDAIYYFETDYPAQANSGCGDRFILYLGAGLPRPGINDPMADVRYLRDTLKVKTYVVGLIDASAPLGDSYRQYMNQLAVAGGGNCASAVIGGPDCAYLAKYDDPGCTDDATCDRLGANDMRTKLGAVLAQMMPQVSSRTRAAVASSSIASGTVKSWRVGGWFEALPGGGQWQGFLRAVEFNAAGVAGATLPFDSNLDARAFSGRRILTSDAGGTTTPLSTVLSSEFSASVTTWRAQFVAANDSCLAANFFDSPDELYEMVAGDTGDALGSAACLAAEDEATMVSNYSKHKLGAIYHSSPFVVTPPELFLNDNTYRDFRTDNANRPLTVYVGANDGMMHAFAIDDDPRTGANEQGSELWAYLPRSVIPALPTGITQNRELLDGAPLVRDVMGERDSAAGVAWRTVLVGALGRGGAALYALDVTDPLDPRALWEHKRGDAGFATMAMQYGPVAVGRLFVTDREIPVAFVQGGWDAGELSTGFPSGRALYIVNLITGAKVWTFTESCGTDTTCTAVSGLNAPLTGTPSPYDDLPAATVSRVFVGDLLGRIWRVDTSNKNPLKWKMQRFWPVAGSPYDNASYQRPIFLPAALAFDRLRRLVVIWSTGNIQDLDDPATNQVWAVREELALAPIVDDPPIVTAVQQWSAPKVLGGAEKLVGDPVVFNGAVLFTTFRQTTSSCGFGQGRLYALDMLSGGPNFALPPGQSGDCDTPGNSCIVTYGAVGTSDSITLGSGVPSTALIRQRPAQANVSAQGRFSFTGGSYQAIVQMGASTRTDQLSDTTVVKELGPLVRRADILSVAEYE